jgi:excisionase family DNA binding protein
MEAANDAGLLQATRGESVMSNESAGLSGTDGTQGKPSGLMTIREVAAFLGRSQASLYRDLKEGRLPSPVALGGSKRWRRSELRAWVKANCPARSAWEGRWPVRA